MVRDDFEKSATSTEESEDKAADEFTKLKLQSKTDISGKTTQKKLNEEIQDGGGKERSGVFFVGFFGFLKKNTLQQNLDIRCHLSNPTFLISLGLGANLQGRIGECGE